jgi:hypothetical protein
MGRWQHDIETTNYDHLVCLGATYDTLGWSYESIVQRLYVNDGSCMLYVFREHERGQESCDCIVTLLSGDYALSD